MSLKDEMFEQMLGEEGFTEGCESCPFLRRWTELLPYGDGYAHKKETECSLEHSGEVDDCPKLQNFMYVKEKSDE